MTRAIDALAGTTMGADRSLKFRDVIIAGKDARVLTAPFGGTVAYIFANQTLSLLAGAKHHLRHSLLLPVKK